MTETTQVWRVVRKVGDLLRTVFEGTEKDARTHVENNFPRAHVEPGAAPTDGGPKTDVVMVGPDGGEHTFNGEWTDHSQHSTAPVEGADDETA